MFTRLFSILWVLGMTGVISLAWMPLPDIDTLPLSLWQIRLLSLIQPTILLTLAVWVWVVLARRVKLSAPAAEALSRGESVSPSCVIGAIALFALLFGVGHLPLAFALDTAVTPAVLAYVLLGNSIFGVIAGYLLLARRFGSGHAGAPAGACCDGCGRSLYRLMLEARQGCLCFGFRSLPYTGRRSATRPGRGITWYLRASSRRRSSV
jgi:hypothetical protein